ncbi:MAG: FCD domain-containing protein, partial [Micrococcales bacterium]|nr:FCD domain-containing protein [Micrococcales bacterium]
ARQRDVIEVRRALEVEAARLAARRRTATDATGLMSARDARAHAYHEGQIDKMVDTDLTLHRAIVKTAANPVLLSLYENLIDAIGENIRFNFVSDTHGADAHDALVEAIVAGNDRRAVEETTDYLSGLVPEA